MRIKIKLNIGIMTMLLMVVCSISFANILGIEESESGYLNPEDISLVHLNSVIDVQSNLACIPAVGGSIISATATGNNVTAGYATEFVLTNAAGAILEHNNTGSFVAPNNTAEYRIYAVNYTTATTPVFTGSSISAIQQQITAATICADISATPKCFDVTKVSLTCTEVVAGTLNGISATASGNNVTPGFATSYVLTNTSGVIQNSNTTGTFNVPATAGEYWVYAINYETTTVPNMANGSTIASIEQAIVAGTICADVSTIPKCFTVVTCTPPVLAVQGGGTTVTICGTGSTATLTAQGCTGGTITWSNGSTGNTITVNPTATTVYTATCTVGTCVSVASNTVTVTVAPATAPTSVTATNLNIVIGGSTILSATCTTGTPSWFSDAALTVALPSTTVSPITGTKYYVSCGVGPCFIPADITINVCPSPENNCKTVKVTRIK